MKLNGRAVGAAVFLSALVAVGALIWSRAEAVSHASRDFPDGIAMICSNPECGHGFTTTLAEIAGTRAIEEDAAVLCPECGRPSDRARVCESCGGYSLAVRFTGGEPSPCPLCGAAPPRLTGTD